jgi:thiamine-phosphate pyrophosphorylase
MTLPSPPLLVITDRTMCRGDLIATMTAAFEGGARWAMLREKDLPRAELLALARRLVAAAKPFGATVLVNGEASVAIEAGAAGVHLPQGSAVSEARRAVGAKGLVGVSAHSLEEVRAAAKAGADYATLSPVFPTESKPGYGPTLGLEAFAAIAGLTDLPLVALAGVSRENARACMAAGAAGVAAMGSVMRAERPEALVSGLVTAISQGIPRAPYDALRT